MGPLRREVRMSAIWRYFIYSVLVGRCCRSLNSPLLLMIQGLFKSIFTIVLFKGPKETRDVSTFLTFQIFWILLCRFPYLEGKLHPTLSPTISTILIFSPRFLHIWLLFFHFKSCHFYIWKHAPGLTTSTPSSFLLAAGTYSLRKTSTYKGTIAKNPPMVEK